MVPSAWAVSAGALPGVLRVPASVSLGMLDTVRVSSHKTKLPRQLRAVGHTSGHRSGDRPSSSCRESSAAWGHQRLVPGSTKARAGEPGNVREQPDTAWTCRPQEQDHQWPYPPISALATELAGPGVHVKSPQGEGAGSPRSRGGPRSPFPAAVERCCPGLPANTCLPSDTAHPPKLSAPRVPPGCPARRAPLCPARAKVVSLLHGISRAPHVEVTGEGWAGLPFGQSDCLGPANKPPDSSWQEKQHTSV